MNFPKDILSFKASGQLTFEPLVDFISLQRIISSVNVNIVPLVKNDFTDCKSELKFFEAAIVKTITCASPSYTYTSCIKDGETGFLCQPGMWYKKIRDIYLKKVDVNGINQKAYEYVNKFYYGSYIIRNIEEAYDFFVAK